MSAEDDQASTFDEPADLPPAGSPPPTMPADAREAAPLAQPAEAREAADPPPAPADATDGIPPGTGPDVPSFPGTSEQLSAVDGVHTPEAGPGGADLDTAEDPLPNRSRTDRS